MRVPRTFVDTNIFVYMIDGGDLSRRTQAISLVQALGSQMVVSTQVLQEFYSVATRKVGIQPQAARDIVLQLSEGEVVPMSSSLVLDGIDLSIVTGFSIWDALIVRAAITARCSRILTEDLNHGQIVHGVRVENPFRADSG